MDISPTNYNLNINAKSHDKMTSEMIIEIEEILLKEAPDVVLLYDDINSTLSGAISATRLKISTAHIDAENRIQTLMNLEEINRILTDRVSSLLLCTIESSIENLHKEGHNDNVYLVGDPMFDTFNIYSDKFDVYYIKFTSLNGAQVTIPSDYYFLICHREENTNDENIVEILSDMQELDARVIFQVRPHVTPIINKTNRNNMFNNIIFIEPVDYLESIRVIKNAKKIVADSDGVQREAFFVDVQCVTILGHIGWPGTMNNHRNQLTKPFKKDILLKLTS